MEYIIKAFELGKSAGIIDDSEFEGFFTYCKTLEKEGLL